VKRKISLVRGALRLCVDGVTIRNLHEYIGLRGGNSNRVLRTIRKTRTHGGFDWTVDERQGKITITITNKPSDEEL